MTCVEVVADKTWMSPEAIIPEKKKMLMIMLVDKSVPMKVIKVGRCVLYNFNTSNESRGGRRVQDATATDQNKTSNTRSSYLIGDS